MRKKGDLQFEAYESEGEYQGFALNTAGSPVAHVSISREPDAAFKEHKVGWAMANPEGRVRAGPHMLLAMMKERFNVDPVADYDLSHEGAKMARSAARRGLIKGHHRNPDMRTSIGHIGQGVEGINSQMTWAHEDALADSHGRVISFNTGQREEAKEKLFPRRKKAKLD